METQASFVAIGALLLGGLGYLIAQVIADVVANEAKEGCPSSPVLGPRAAAAIGS